MQRATLKLRFRRAGPTVLLVLSCAIMYLNSSSKPISGPMPPICQPIHAELQNLLPRDAAEAPAQIPLPQLEDPAAAGCAPPPMAQGR